MKYFNFCEFCKFEAKHLECLNYKMKLENRDNFEKSIRAFQFANYTPNLPFTFGIEQQHQQVHTPFILQNHPMVVRENFNGRRSMGKRISKMDSTGNLTNLNKKTRYDESHEYHIIECPPAQASSKKNKTFIARLKRGFKKINSK